MDIHQVTHTLVMTSRLDGMGHLSIKVLKGVNGQESVALDPIGTRPGDWVITIAYSAARTAAGDDKTLTDLTISGIIDHWQDD